MRKYTHSIQYMIKKAKKLQAKFEKERVKEIDESLKLARKHLIENKESSIVVLDDFLEYTNFYEQQLSDLQGKIDYLEYESSFNQEVYERKLSWKDEDNRQMSYLNYLLGLVSMLIIMIITYFIV